MIWNGSVSRFVRSRVNMKYCWWFRNPANHLGCIKPLELLDKLPSSTDFPRRISSIIVATSPATMNFCMSSFCFNFPKDLGQHCVLQCDTSGFSTLEEVEEGDANGFLGKKTHHGDTGFATYRVCYMSCFCWMIFFNITKKHRLSNNMMDSFCRISDTLLFFFVSWLMDFLEPHFLKLIWLALSSPRLILPAFQRCESRRCWR